MAYSTDGRYLAASTFGVAILVWDAHRGVLPPAHVLLKHQGPVVAINFSPDGTRLVSGSRDGGMLCLWRVEGGRIVEETSMDEEGVGIWSLAFTP